MKKFIALMLAFAWLGLIPMEVTAAEFQWMKELNAEASQDLTRFNQALQDRFGLAKDRIQDIMDRTASAADAYMSLKLGEMSQKSVDEVIEKSENGKQKGWGALAKSLGIKPGSQEFHALKQGHDLYSDNDTEKGSGSGKGKGKSNKGKGKKKN